MTSAGIMKRNTKSSLARSKGNQACGTNCPSIHKEHLTAIIDSAMDAIITVDEQQRIVLFNTAAEQVFECRRADAIGKSLDQFIPQRFREAHREHIQTFGRAGKTSRSMHSPAMLSGVRLNGEEFLLRLRFPRQLPEDGDFTP